MCVFPVLAQATYGLLVCFLTFGAYTAWRPYAEASDDRLSQLCQVQIFFALIASIIMQVRHMSPGRGGGWIWGVGHLFLTVPAFCTLPREDA